MSRVAAGCMALIADSSDLGAAIMGFSVKIKMKETSG
jgi:hypothetical protein